jgi:hypothetical protein
METGLKTMFLMEMFSGFPAFKTSGDTFKMTLASYLEAIQRFPSEIVRDASLKARRNKSSEWPPSAPQFYDLCSDLNARLIQIKRESAPRLSAPVEQYTDEHREAMKARFAKLVDDLKHGRLPPPRHGFTDEQLADPSCIVNRKGQTPYTLRPGPPFGFKDVHAPYGFLTPKELAAPSVVMPVKRTKSPSFREKWERQKNWNDAGDYMQRRYGEAAE